MPPLNTFSVMTIQLSHLFMFVNTNHKSVVIFYQRGTGHKNMRTIFLLSFDCCLLYSMKVRDEIDRLGILSFENGNTT